MTIEQPATAGNPTVTNVMQPLHDAAGWMKLIGTLAIIQGVLLALTIVGLIIAWLPIWLGVLLNRVHMQSLVVIQPIDILADGRQNMCDGCPDITQHDGRLVWSCRLEECLNFGCFISSSPKPDVAAQMVKQPEADKKTKITAVQ